MRHRPFVLALASFVVLGFLPSRAVAQAAAAPAQAARRSQVSGTVHSADGAALADRLVQLRNRATHIVVATGRTDANGRFVFEFSEAGQFAVELLASTEDHKVTAVGHSVTVALGESVTADIDAAGNVPAIGVEIGENVWVTNTDGVELRGDILNLSASELELKTSAGIKRIGMTDVLIVAKKDSNWNGFLIGALVGGLSGALVGPTYIDELHRENPKAQTPSVAVLTISSALFYGGVGAFIDNQIQGRDVVYRKPSSAVAVRVAPLVSVLGARGIGLGGSITWR